MSFQVLANRQFASPSAAASATVAATGVAWTNTAWVQIAPTTDVVWILTSVIVWVNIGVSTAIDFEVDIGTGGIGSEVVLTTVRGRHSTAGVSMYQQPIRLPIPIDNLNGRHSFRLRTSSTRTDTWNCAITYIKNPVSGTLLVTRSPTLVAPAAAAPVTLTAGSTWLSGTWVQLLASASADLVLIGAVLSLSANSQAEVDIGIGAASSEVAITTFRYGTQTTQVSPSFFELPNPLDAIPSGSRVAARMRCSSSGATSTAAIVYHAKPL